MSQQQSLSRQGAFSGLKSIPGLQAGVWEHALPHNEKPKEAFASARRARPEPAGSRIRSDAASQRNCGAYADPARTYTLSD